jgi:hypothetical protein
MNTTHIFGSFAFLGRHLVRLMTLLLCLSLLSQAQPYYYYMAWDEIHSDLPSHQKEYLGKLCRYSFSSLETDTLLRELSGLQYKYVSGDQQRVFLGFGDRYGIMYVRFVRSFDPLLMTDVAPETDAFRLMYLTEAPLVNRLYLRYANVFEDKPGDSYVLILDATTFQVIDSTTQFPGAIQGPGYFLSRDQRTLYDWVFDRAGFFFETFSAIDGSPLPRIRIGSVTDIPYGPGLEAGRNGYAVWGFGYQKPKAHGFETQVYAFCDVDARTIMAEVPFPWRAEVTLSGDGRKAIVEETPVSGRTGRYWVFDMHTGRLLQRFSVPVRGMMHIFETHPDEIFYVTQEEQPAQRINLRMETPTSELLDTLASQLLAAFGCGWIGEASFVNELRRHLTNAARMLSNGNASGSAAQLESFRMQVKSAFEAGTKQGDNRWVTMDCYKELYFNAGYVLDRMRTAKE